MRTFALSQQVGIKSVHKQFINVLIKIEFLTVIQKFKKN